MSLVIHEAYSFDSQELELFWWDDFLGDQVQDEWAVSGTGSVVVVDQQTGGIARITTGAVSGNDERLFWNNIRSLLVIRRLSFETRIKLETTANIYSQFGAYFDWDNLIRFRYDTSAAHTNWMLWCENNNVATEADSGIAVDASYHIFRIEVQIEGGNHAHFYIDPPTECGNSPITTNLPVTGGSEYLQPQLYIITRTNATRYMDTDYVGVRQLI